MPMNGPGMWMPKRKYGKHWQVSYSLTVGRETHEKTRKFRVKADARDFVDYVKSLSKRNPDITNFTFKIEKLLDV